MAHETKAAELRRLAPEELEGRIEERRKELMDLRFSAEAGRLEKPHRIRLLKREVARLLTVRRQLQTKEKGK